MIKVGDRVYIWNKMSMTGEVAELRAIPLRLGLLVALLEHLQWLKLILIMGKFKKF